MQPREAVNEAVLVNPFVGGTFDYEQLGWPNNPANIETGELGLMPEAHELIELYEYMDPEEQAELDRILQSESRPRLLPHQIVPWWIDSWERMFLNGGRGVGKTVAGSTACIEHMEAVGRKARVGIGAPTNSDARDTCLEGETGLMTLYGSEFKYYNRSLFEARHKNGGYVKAMGTEKPKRWNGPQWSFLWFDEFSLCNRKAIDDALLGLRLGPKTGPWRARAIFTLTPKGQRWVKELLELPDAYVPHYIGPDGKPRFPTTFDNPYLPEHRVEILRKQFQGTRLGMQELLGLFIGDTPGAKWNREIIHHIEEERWPRFLRIVVAIDPAGTSVRKKADENATSEVDRANMKRNASTAICVAAKGTDGKIYILAWIADQWTPNQWASKAIELFRMFRADRIVAEKNFGGDMVEANIRNSWADAPVTLVTASRGKDVRAEPVVSLYEQRRVIHMTVFPEAEHQMCAFIDADHNEGADYVDSGVWAVWELMGWNDPGGASLVGSQTELSGFQLIV